MDEPTTHDLDTIEEGVVCVDKHCQLRGEIINTGPFTLRELKKLIIEHERRERINR